MRPHPPSPPRADGIQIPLAVRTAYTGPLPGPRSSPRHCLGRLPASLPFSVSRWWGTSCATQGPRMPPSLQRSSPSALRWGVSQSMGQGLEDIFLLGWRLIEREQWCLQAGQEEWLSHKNQHVSLTSPVPRPKPLFSKP